METVEVKDTEVVPFAYQDVYRPTLKNSPSLLHTDEQDAALKNLLKVCCSDSQFAKKCYDSLKYILSQIEPPAAPLSMRVPGEALTKEELLRRRAEEKALDEQIKKDEEELKKAPKVESHKPLVTEKKPEDKK